MIERRQLSSGRISWRVRWYGPDGKERSKSFGSRKDAQAFDADRRSARGSWASPDASSITLTGVWSRFLPSQTHLKPSTVDDYERAWRNHVQPAFGTWPVGRIRFSDVSAWVGTMSSKAGVATTRKTFAVLSRVLGWAVDAGHLNRNPAIGVRLPRPNRADVNVATPAQLDALIEAAPASVREAIEVLAFTGMRWGELAALQTQDVDVVRRVVRVRRTTCEIGGELHVGSPKTHQHRDVPMIGRVTQILEARVGTSPTDLLFSSRQGTPWRNGNFRRAAGWKELTEGVGLARFRIHDLRHTAASLMLQSGASVVDVSAVLGHANSHTTLTVYAHVVGSRLDDVSGRLETLLNSSVEDRRAL